MLGNILQPKLLLVAGVFLLPANHPPQAKSAASSAPLTEKVVVDPSVSVPTTAKETQAFGAENEKLYGKGFKHDGEDLGNQCGQEVKSPTNGQVVAVDWKPEAYGDSVSIDGYDGYRHLLGHTEHTGIQVGQFITQGQVVGHTNLSGHSTGCHLHWSTILEDKFVDPKRWKSEPNTCPHLVNVPTYIGVHVCAASTKYPVDSGLVASILFFENRAWPAATKNVCSPMGACGIAQFMPATFEAYGVDGDGDGKAERENWIDSIYSAANYLAKQHGDITEKAIRYNCGGGCVGKALPQETREYVQGVITKYKEVTR